VRFLLDPPGGDVREWDPHDPPADLRPDARYWNDVFRELPPAELTVVLTWSTARLPVEGDDVVAVVLADEASRRPAYAARVGALFKCYGDRPRISRSPFGGRLDAAIWLQDLRRSAEALRDPRGRPPAHPIPLGLVRPLPLPDPPPPASRPIDVSFAGSVEEVHRRLPSAKVLSRRRMLAALPRAIRSEIRVTESFGASIEQSPDEYAAALVATKVLLAPRGGSVETFRFYEGMLAGCVVVTEPLPPFWFYAGSPAVTVRDWGDLPDVLEKLLGDPEELQRRHEASLAWWRDRLSPAAVGRYIAERLPNSTSVGVSRSISS
jgi:hypothetical protein